MMCRFLDMSLMIYLSVSLMFIGVESMSALPPPKNLNFAWETPFSLYVTWDRPEDLDPDCNVNYTINVSHSQDCSLCTLCTVQKRRVTNNSHRQFISNEKGLCINVTTNPENCGNRRESPPETIIIPAPPVTLVTDRGCEYSHNRMKCTWRPVADVKDLGFYYWFSPNESPIACISNKRMETGGCVIHNKALHNLTQNMFYLFNGTYNGQVVQNTFMDENPRQYVKLKQPQLTVQRVGKFINFTTNASDLNEFGKHCYKYKYTYSKCDENFITEVLENSSNFSLEYDPSCKYKARVRIIFDNSCGKGSSDPSDEVEYGENSDPNLPALLAVILIPLIVSCCLIVALVLLRRHKEMILPKIPDPSLFFKDMLINNTRMAEEPRCPAADRLYVPFEETVESRIILEPDTSLH